jgi:dTDP-glucose pyrophosphorylase
MTLAAAARAGIKRACLVIPAGDETIREQVGSGRKWGLDVVYARQAEPLGSADALLAVVREQIKWVSLKEPVLVTATDYFMRKDLLADLVEGYARSGCEIAMSLELRRSKSPEQRPGVMPGEDGRVRRLLAEAEIPGAYEASLIYILPPDIWEILPELKPKEGGRFEITSLVNHLLENQFTACGLMQSLPRAWDADLLIPRGKGS